MGRVPCEGAASPYALGMRVGPDNIPQVVAEIGCNHKGEVELAKELVRTAAQATDPNYWVQHLRHTVRCGDGFG